MTNNYKTDQIHVDKRFLSNNPHETSSISCIICFEKTYNEKGLLKFARVDSEVVVKDCYRSITIDFNLDHGVTKEDRLEKIDNMIEALTVMRAKLVPVYDEYLEAREEIKRNLKDNEDDQ